jgi:hypothetical protein
MNILVFLLFILVPVLGFRTPTVSATSFMKRYNSPILSAPTPPKPVKAPIKK